MFIQVVVTGLPQSSIQGAAHGLCWQMNVRGGPVCCNVAGRGVSKDVQTALNYYGMAFDLGHWKAAYVLGTLYAGNERE
jgi:hypothetical protein